MCVCDLLRQWRLVRTVLGVLCVHYHLLLRDRDLGSSKQKSLPVSFSRRVQCPGPATFFFFSLSLSLRSVFCFVFLSLTCTSSSLSPPFDQSTLTSQLYPLSHSLTHRVQCERENIYILHPNRGNDIKKIRWD